MRLKVREVAKSGQSEALEALETVSKLSEPIVRHRQDMCDRYKHMLP